MKEGEIALRHAAPNTQNASTPSAHHSLQPASVPVDPASVRRFGMARALQLGSQLRVHVIVDSTGWLSDGVEIIYRRELGCSIHPITVRVGRDARDEDVLAEGGALGICQRYNEALAKLRRLAARLAKAEREGGTFVAANPRFDAARRAFSELDACVASRQLQHMGSGVVRLDRLRSEIAFFEERSACLLADVIAAEQEAHPSWEADTQDLDE